MYKRRDYLLNHRREGDSSDSDSDSSDDSSEVSQQPDVGIDGEAVSSREAPGTDDEAGSGGGSDAEGSDDGSDEERRYRLRMQMPEDSDNDGPGPSGSEYESGLDSDLESDDGRVPLPELLSNWMHAPDGETLRGAALRCRVCAGSLLLSAVALRQHVGSKRHRSAVASLDDPLQPLAYANRVDAPEEEETETHAERLQRLEAIVAELEAKKAAAAAAAPAAAGANTLSAAAARRRRRKAKAEAGKAPPKRPGKRQRALLKAEGAAQGAAERGDGRKGKGGGRKRARAEGAGGTAKVVNKAASGRGQVHEIEPVRQRRKSGGKLGQGAKEKKGDGKHDGIGGKASAIEK